MDLNIPSIVQHLAAIEATLHSLSLSHDIPGLDRKLLADKAAELRLLARDIQVIASAWSLH